MSTREWTPSESIPELPERDAAVNFAADYLVMAAITTLAVSAAAMVLGVLESSFLLLARAEPSGSAVTERSLWFGLTVLELKRLA